MCGRDYNNLIKLTLLVNALQDIIYKVFFYKENNSRDFARVLFGPVIQSTAFPMTQGLMAMRNLYHYPYREALVNINSNEA